MTTTKIIKPDASITFQELVDAGHGKVSLGQVLIELGIEVPQRMWTEKWEQTVRELYPQAFDGLDPQINISGFGSVRLACLMAHSSQESLDESKATDAAFGVSIAPGSRVHNLFILMNEADRDAIRTWLTTEETQPTEPLGRWTLTEIIDDYDEYVGCTFQGLGQRFDLTDPEVNALLVLMGV